VKGQGGALHGFENGGLYMQHLNYYNAHLDAMWNLANYWGAYSPSKVISFGPYIGLGFAHRFADKTIPVPLTPPAWIVSGNANNYHGYSNVISINAGLNLGFNLSKRISLDFDLGAAVVPDYFDRMVRYTENEAIASISGGITFKLGKVDFEIVEPMDYALLNDLNEKVNTLRAENARLAKRPVSCPECPQAPVVKADGINYVPNVVFFRLNSDKVDANQQVSIYNTAEFMKKTGEKIKVVGYADKSTGTNNYNMKISKKRAQSVAKELMKRYKIPSGKITVEWKGSGEQPYPYNNWNRVVIMSIPD
jgi:outer membrane protein OmpA-like peptidoglycan-associated protein